ncbi:hypothetical protein [Kitasatospora sp. NPDC094016]|uniref:hypothetical protein n=1 Tax=Kitasatospora sp. NPDC094016 TaxID=3154986 RepID=UPI00332ED579
MTTVLTRVRRPAQYLAAAALAAAAVTVPGTAQAGTAKPAAAPAVDASCPTGNATVDLSPGATLEQRQTAISLRGNAGPCISSDPAITAISSFSGTGQGMVSCLDAAYTFTATVVWNTGEVSTVAASSTLNLGPLGDAVAVISGPVTSGKFAGDTVEVQIALLPDSFVGCVTPQGVTQLQGTVIATFAHL